MNALVQPGLLDSEGLHGVQFGNSGQAHRQALPFSVTLRAAHVNLPEGAAVWQREDAGERYRSITSLHASDAGYVLSIDCEGRGRFLVTDQQILVDWREGTDYVHYLQTLAVALFLELNGVPCVHANAIAVDDEHAIGLLAPSRGGKSTLSHALVMAGARLMTDDMLALHPSTIGCTVHPARPVLRLWPDSIRNVTSLDETELPRVHQRFAKRELSLAAQDCVASSPRKLSALLVLDRQSSEDGCERDRNNTSEPFESQLELITGSAALVHMLQQSMLADAYSQLGLEQQRVTALSRLLDAIPVYRLRYASGVEHLPAVSQQILAVVPK
jgi:hypothetical protein